MAVDEHVRWVVLIQRVVDGIPVRLDKLRRLTGEHLTTQHGQLFQVPARSSQQIELTVERLRSRRPTLHEQVLLNIDTAEVSVKTGKR